MQVEFEKWHGCQNDFIVLWMSRNDLQYGLKSLQSAAPNLCSREGGGVAADGIIICQVAERGQVEPEKIHIINQDGSMAKNCGNGLRCAAMSCFNRFEQLAKVYDRPQGLEFQVLEHLFWIDFIQPSAGGGDVLASVTMPAPLIDQKVDWFAKAEDLIEHLKKFHPHPELYADWHAVDIGNRHLVFFVEQWDEQLGQKIGHAAQCFADGDGINVHLVSVGAPSKATENLGRKALQTSIAESAHAYVWERGVGPTQACGSGACAVSAVYLEQGFYSREEWFAVEMPGGSLFCQQPEKGAPIRLTGAAQKVFTGIFEL